MNKNNVKKLNVFKIPIQGINLIEASAGTGKTFTIVLLYIRLLLGIGQKNNSIKKYLVDEILIVTFTNSAKEELYTRIKNSIKNLYIACITKESKDIFSRLFLKEIVNIDEAIEILKKAQNDINHASIYTIHGFCQKMLQLYNFNFHAIFKEKIIEYEDELYLKATQDFWRRSFYNLPQNIIQIIDQDYNSPESLLKKIKPFLHLKLTYLKKIKSKTLILYHQNNINKINIFKKIWLTHFQIILDTMNILEVNKRIYNKSNVARWINEITIWAQSFTKDYKMPISLKYFSVTNIQKNTKNKNFLNHIIFKEIEKILKTNFSLKNIIMFHAIKKIPKILTKEKETQCVLGFNDLLNMFLKTIKKEKILQQLIHEKYPIAFIDEFQDTDMQQYKIFYLIYQKNKKTALFLIGDPKQAIYSFRGADIFSYLYVKSRIKKHYYLDTNWRSSVNMSKSINFLFSQSNNPFIFENIPFIPITSSCKNSHMNFMIKNVLQTSLTFFLNQKTEICLDDYQIWISKKCAHEISYWLNCAKNQEAIITTKNGSRILKANDIAILVRNKKEANIVQKELKKMNITSIYSSAQNNIFKTSDAQELLWLLKLILEPTNEQLLKKSSTTNILNSLFDIEKKTIEYKNSYFTIEKLYKYNDIWEKIGIFYMIKQMILDYEKNFNFLERNIDYEKNFNFLHIAELLQEKFETFHEKKTLVRWFEKKILKKTQGSSNEYIRYLNTSEAVKIVTIHKSKGLEYPIVWLPFIIDFNQSKNSIYHDKKNFKTLFDIEQNNKSLLIADEERLAEDIRFLYVALTRSTLHCSIGIGCLVKKKIKNRKNSDLHHSALGYIIQNGKKMNYENLFNTLNQLKYDNLIEIKNKTSKFKLSPDKKNIYLTSTRNLLKKEIKNTWNLTSFTALNKENKLLSKNKNNILIEDIKVKKNTKKILTVHNFPSGIKTGLLIHYILKKIDILSKKNYIWFAKILEKYDISQQWTSTLISWIFSILHTPFSHHEIVLSKLKKKMYVTELEFFLPIKNILYNNNINDIIQSLDTISISSSKFLFNPVTGILKGYIDLVFFWKNKYYIIDYKSNWLGKNNTFYSKKYITQEMVKKRYDLQYQIYTIAVHKYLEKKIKNYNYKKDFGGVFYIFLRAVSHEKNRGIFYTIPNYSLIKKIINLIS